ncbi:MAG: hypothetical protein PF692_07945 [Kiritimatiellae bacterium]|jgi:hypothetical protein|nr:hypothetical protein [Kiritimatiellia bacterium]
MRLDLKTFKTILCDKTGQTMVEYMIMTVMIVFALSVMAVFLFTFREFGSRVLDLVAADFP